MSAYLTHTPQKRHFATLYVTYISLLHPHFRTVRAVTAKILHSLIKYTFLLRQARVFVTLNIVEEIIAIAIEELLLLVCLLQMLCDHARSPGFILSFSFLKTAVRGNELHPAYTKHDQSNQTTSKKNPTDAGLEARLGVHGSSGIKFLINEH